MTGKPGTVLLKQVHVFELHTISSDVGMCKGYPGDSVITYAPANAGDVGLTLGAG